MDPSRREVALWLVTGAAAGAVVTLGCGGPEQGAPDAGGGAGPDGGGADAGALVPDGGATADGGGGGHCPNGAGNIKIGGNTGHVLVVSAQDILAAEARTYDIRGTATHVHTVHLTAGDFAALARGESVEVQSSRDVFHSHQVTISCG